MRKILQQIIKELILRNNLLIATINLNLIDKLYILRIMTFQDLDPSVNLIVLAVGFGIVLIALILIKKQTNFQNPPKSATAMMLVLGGLLSAISILILIIKDFRYFILLGIIIAILVLMTYIINPIANRIRDDTNKDLFDQLIPPLVEEITQLMNDGKYELALSYLNENKDTFLEFPNEGVSKYTELKSMIKYQLKKLS